MTEAVVLLAYATLLVEIVVFPVPSVASSLAVMKGDVGSSRTRLSRARSLPPLVKLVLFVLPTGLCIVFFLLPLGILWRPALWDALGRLPALESPPFVAAGLALVAFGRTLTFASVVAIRGGRGRWWRAAPPDALAREQLFSRSRNPGLVGMFSFYAGLVLVFPCWVLLLGIPFYFGHMHFRVLLEESHLGARFGSLYDGYRADTRRYL